MTLLRKNAGQHNVIRSKYWKFSQGNNTRARQHDKHVFCWTSSTAQRKSALLNVTAYCRRWHESVRLTANNHAHFPGGKRFFVSRPHEYVSSCCQSASLTDDGGGGGINDRSTNTWRD